MKKNDKSKSEGIENFLCPTTDLYITQGAGEKFSHKGVMACDIRGKEKGVRYPYFAPCSCKCIKTYESFGEAIFKSIDKVRFANGIVDYAVFITAHDNNMIAKENMIFMQGDLLGHMGDKGKATGVHLHFEVGTGPDTKLYKNKYGNYALKNEIDLDDAMFIDNTNILTKRGSWKYTNKINNKKYLNLPKTFTKWRVYKENVIPIKKNACGYLNTKKFGGLSYEILGFTDNNSCVVIKTRDYGIVKIYIKKTKASITFSPLY